MDRRSHSVLGQIHQEEPLREWAGSACATLALRNEPPPRQPSASLRDMGRCKLHQLLLGLVRHAPPSPPRYPGRSPTGWCEASSAPPASGRIGTGPASPCGSPTSPTEGRGPQAGRLPRPGQDRLPLGGAAAGPRDQGDITCSVPYFPDSSEGLLCVAWQCHR